MIMKRSLFFAFAPLAALATLAFAAPAFAVNDYPIKDATGATQVVCAKDNGTSKATCHVIVDASTGAEVVVATAAKQDTANTALGAPGDTVCATDNGSCSLEALVKRTNARITSLITALGSPLQANGPVAGFATSVTVTVQRPGNTTTYTANTAWADSTSAATVPTLTGACRTSGGHGIITAASIVSSNDPTTPLQGELWFLDSAPTAINDNAWSISDADMQKVVAGGILPFTLASNAAAAASGTSSIYTQSGLGIGFACSGSANLRVIPKVKNPYVPANAETLFIRLNVVQTD